MMSVYRPGRTRRKRTFGTKLSNQFPSSQQQRRRRYSQAPTAAARANKGAQKKKRDTEDVLVSGQSWSEQTGAQETNDDDDDDEESLFDYDVHSNTKQVALTINNHTKSKIGIQWSSSKGQHLHQSCPDSWALDRIFNLPFINPKTSGDSFQEVGNSGSWTSFTPNPKIAWKSHASPSSLLHTPIISVTDKGEVEIQAISSLAVVLTPATLRSRNNTSAGTRNSFWFSPFNLKKIASSNIKMNGNESSLALASTPPPPSATSYLQSPPFSPVSGIGGETCLVTVAAAATTAKRSNRSEELQNVHAELPRFSATRSQKNAWLAAMSRELTPNTDALSGLKQQLFVDHEGSSMHQRMHQRMHRPEMLDSNHYGVLRAFQREKRSFERRAETLVERIGRLAEHLDQEKEQTDLKDKEDASAVDDEPSPKSSKEYHLDIAARLEKSLADVESKTRILEERLESAKEAKLEEIELDRDGARPLDAEKCEVEERMAAVESELADACLAVAKEHHLTSSTLPANLAKAKEGTVFRSEQGHGPQDPPHGKNTEQMARISLLEARDIAEAERDDARRETEEDKMLLSRLKSEKEELTSKLVQAEADIVCLKVEKEELVSKSTGLEESVTEVQGEINSLSAYLGASKSKNSEVDSRTKHAIARYNRTVPDIECVLVEKEHISNVETASTIKSTETTASLKVQFVQFKTQVSLVNQERDTLAAKVEMITFDLIKAQEHSRAEKLRFSQRDAASAGYIRMLEERMKEEEQRVMGSTGDHFFFY